MCPQAKEYQRLPANHQKQGEAWNRFSQPIEGTALPGGITQLQQDPTGPLWGWTLVAKGKVREGF